MQSVPPTVDEMVRLIAYVAGAVVDSGPLLNRINSVLSCVTSAFSANACVVRELNGNKLQLLATSGVKMSALPATLNRHEGIAKTLLETRRGQIVADVPVNPITASIYASSPPGHFKFRHFAGAPMLVEGEPVGVLGIYRLEDRAFTEQDITYLEIVANELAASIQNSQLYKQQLQQSEQLRREIRQRKQMEKKLRAQVAHAEQLAKSNERLVARLQNALKQLSQAYDATLEGWCAALDLRDEGTMGHTQRVTKLAVGLARKVGYPTESIDSLRRGALLHDIGKMAIPDAILFKPGPLTTDEWQIMRRHPEYAEDFLARVDFLQASGDIPLYHHEKWNGDGYPRGLSGNGIPLAARIFAVVDVWDALCSNRPYREAWPTSKVIDYIREHRGSHFDPQITDVFLEMVENGSDLVA